MIKYYKNDNNEIRAVEQVQEFLVQEDWIEITLEELQELQKPTEEQILAGKIAEAKAYLASTDFKMTVDYFATLTEAEQVELTRLRAEAREFIRANEGAING